MIRGAHHHTAEKRADQQRQSGVVTNVPTSSAEIDQAMMKVMRACLAEGRAIDVGEFHKALVPSDQVAPRFHRLLAEVRAERRRAR